MTDLTTLREQRDAAQEAIWGVVRHEAGNGVAAKLDALLRLHAQVVTLENAEKLETYPVESVEWAHLSNDIEPNSTRLVVKGTVPQAGAGDRIAFLRATVEGA